MDSLKLLRKQFGPGFDSRHLHQIGQCVIDLPGLINDRPGTIKGMAGFDRLQVGSVENPESHKWQIDQHVSTAVEGCCVNRSPGCEIPGSFIKGWPLYDELPEGWHVAEGITTSPNGYTAIATGSIFNGTRKIGLIK